MFVMWISNGQLFKIDLLVADSLSSQYFKLEENP